MHRRNWIAAFVAALMILSALPAGANVTGAVTADTGTVTASTGTALPTAAGTFTDDDGSTFEEDIEWLAAVGITTGCGGTNFCPNDFVTRGQMAAFLVRALRYTDNGGGDLFTDDDNSIFEDDIDKLGTAGVTRGCNPPANTRFCPEDFVTRGQMAAFLVRALNYTDNGGGNLFTDDDNSVFEDDIDKLGTAGVTRGCNPPANTRFCPDDFVTRGQMAAFLHRALGDIIPNITGTLPNGFVGIPYSRQLTLTTAYPPVVAQKTAGPAWASVSPTGVVSGTPTAGGSYVIGIRVTNDAGYTTTRSFPITIVSGCEGNISLPQSECDALVALFNATNGGTWTNKTGWLSGNPCTEWYGVSCALGTNVTGLELDENNLIGQLPNLSALTQLETLDLTGNALNGAIPGTLGNLKSLITLRLDDNSFSGQIPSGLGSIGTQLVTLELGGNPLTGPIPSTIWNLTGLETLNFSESSISGSLSANVGNLQNLQLFSLGETDVGGTLPAAALTSLTDLVDLNLSETQFSSPIPANIGNLTNLVVLDLEDSTIGGPIPTSIGSLTNLLTLDLSGMANLAGATIPTQITNLNGLEFLDLSESGLTGTIPTNIGNLGTALGFLDLSSNQLSGEIPASITTLIGLNTGTLALDTQTGVPGCFTWPADGGATQAFVTALDPATPICP